MILYKGKFVSFVQYMAAKPIKHGIKVFALCCSYTGYPFGFEVYLGKDNSTDGSVKETVMRLLHDSHMSSMGRGRTLVTDNFYTSLDLMKSVFQVFGMTYIGTIPIPQAFQWSSV